VINTNLLYILSRTVSKLLQVIVQICAFDIGYLCLTHLFGMNPKLMTTKVSLKELATSPYCVVQMRFDMLNRLGLNRKCDGRTDGQTDKSPVRNSAV